MSGLPGIAVPFGNVWLEDVLFLLSCGPSGHIQIESVRENGKFQAIKCANTPLTNRSRFTCCSLGSSCILLISGDGVGISSTELWVFSLETRNWSELKTTQAPIKRRSGHCSVVSRNYVYIFGGTYGLDFCNDLVIITLDSELRGFSYKILPTARDGLPGRCCHTMTLKRSTAYVHGGVREDGSVLGDLWQLDFSLFPENPSWHLVEKQRAPHGRLSHVSWNDQNGDFFTAGGMSEHDQVFNEIWRFGRDNLWELVQIYETAAPLLGSSKFGLVAVSDHFECVRTEPPSASLDSYFRSLGTKQSEYVRRPRIDFDGWQELSRTADQLRGFSRNVEGYMQNCKGGTSVSASFTSQTQASLQNEVDRVRSEIAQLTREIVARFPAYLEEQQTLARPSAEELAIQLALKLQQTHCNLKRTLAERRAEIELSRAHLTFLKRGAKDVWELDPADFDAFVRFAQRLPQAQQSFAWDQFYRMQLREYQRLTMEIRATKAQSSKLVDGQPKRAQMANRLSDQLTAKFRSVSDLGRRLAERRQALADTEADIQRCTDFLGAVRAFQVNRATTEQRVATMEAKNAKVQQQMKVECDELDGHGRSVLEELLQKVNSIAETIAGRPPEEAICVIDFEFPEINKLAVKIAPRPSR
jgi:hypothetical protein